MKPSREAKEMLDDADNDNAQKAQDFAIEFIKFLIIIFFIAIVVIADVYFERRVHEQERVEKIQKQLKEPKLQEM